MDLETQDDFQFFQIFMKFPFYKFYGEKNFFFFFLNVGFMSC